MVMLFRVAIAAIILLSTQVHADELSCSQIRFIAPFGAGGSADVATRFIAERMEAVLKKTTVIENRPGATGNIGTVAVASADPDGCTLLVNGTVIATFPTSFARLSYNPFKSLVPVGSIGTTPNILVAGPELPANDVKSLITLAKTRPGGISYGTSGYGLQQHLVVEVLASKTNSKFVQISYKSAPAIVTDLIGNRIEFGSLLIGTTKALVEDKKLKALAVVQDERSTLLPDVPSTAEQGYPGILGATHFVVFAPGGTPKPIVAVLDAALHQIVSDPKVKERFATIGFEAKPMTSDEVTVEMHRVADAFVPIIKQLDLKLE
jgi:tripartite-type tricarboxylate transporter receptor subunit TctC